jgi:hypothetical protein
LLQKRAFERRQLMTRKLSQLAFVGVSDKLMAAVVPKAMQRGIEVVELHEDSVFFTDLGPFNAVVVGTDQLKDPSGILDGLTEILVPVFLVTSDGAAPPDVAPRSLGVGILSHCDLRTAPTAVLRLIADSIWD